MKLYIIIFASMLLCAYATADREGYESAESEAEAVEGEAYPMRHHHGRHGHKMVGHFCRCFKEMIKCIKRHSNKTVKMDDDKFVATEMFNRDPMEFEDDMVVEEKNNGSKGNYTHIKKCVHHFKKCLRKRPHQAPKPEAAVPPMNLVQKIWGALTKKFGMGHGMSGGKHSGRFGRYSKFSKLGSKFASKFGSKYGSKFSSKFGGVKSGGGKYGGGKSGGQMNKNHRRGPFYRCFMAGKRCKKQAKRSKKMMKKCGKKFAMCILGQCKRIKHRG